MSDAFSAETYVFDRLDRAVEGLPIFIQSSLFDNLRAHIYGLAQHYQLGQWPDREAALRRAADDVIGDPAERNQEYRQEYRWEILRERPADACALIWQLLRKPSQRQTYKGPLSRPFGPETALQNDPDLLERLRAGFGGDYVDRINWPGTFAWPLQYLGCAATESYLVFSVGHEIWEDYGGTYHRHVTYYAFVENDPAPQPVASSGICWTAEEGIVYPVSFDTQRVVGRYSQVAEWLSGFCTNWLTTQCETVKLFMLDDQGKPLLAPVSGPRRQGRFAKIWFDLPDLSERQIAWAIFGAVVLLLCVMWWAMATFMPVDMSHTELPPPPPDIIFDLTPPTLEERLRGYGILAAIIGGFLAVVVGSIVGLYHAARGMARDLLISTPLGVSKQFRPVIYHRRGQDD